MIETKFLRSVCTVFAFIILFGGYAMHQWSLFNGTLSEWTAKIAQPNILIGWLFFVLALVLTIIKEPEEEEQT